MKWYQRLCCARGQVSPEPVRKKAASEQQLIPQTSGQTLDGISVSITVPDDTLIEHVEQVRESVLEPTVVMNVKTEKIDFSLPPVLLSRKSIDREVVQENERVGFVEINGVPVSVAQPNIGQVAQELSVQAPGRNRQPFKGSNESLTNALQFAYTAIIYNSGLGLASLSTSNLDGAKINARDLPKDLTDDEYYQALPQVPLAHDLSDQEYYDALPDNPPPLPLEGPPDDLPSGPIELYKNYQFGN